jgi:thiol-disulfide isomerase/thioredoxin
MLLLLVSLCLCAAAQDIAGLWNATVLNLVGDPVAFQLELKRSGSAWQGALVNGNDQMPSTSGHFHNNKLHLEFDYWDGVLEAELRDGVLSGAFTRRYKKETRIRKFHAQRSPLPRPKATAEVDVSGDWILDTADKDGKQTIYRAQFKQSADRLEATLIPVSGDTGMLIGYVSGRSLEVSRFDGIRASLLKGSVNSEGVLEGALDSTSTVKGYPAAKAPLLPPDAMNYTRMRNPGEPFRFAYPDLNGTVVSSEDAQFRNKVVLVTITGSWCPNCHEEAPFLIELYRRYHDRGLEVVAIAFEYTGETERDLRQLRIFARKYGMPYPVLLAGTTDDAEQKLGQLENFGAYPTTIFIGRDGRVRAIHAGFDGPATGALFTELKREMEERVQRLLAE